MWDIGQGQVVMPRMRKICTKYHFFLFHCNVRYRSRSSIVAENEAGMKKNNYILFNCNVTHRSRSTGQVLLQRMRKICTKHNYFLFHVMWDIGRGQVLLLRMEKICAKHHYHCEIQVKVYFSLSCVLVERYEKWLKYMLLFVWFDSLHPSQQFFQSRQTGLPGLNQH